MAGLKNAARSPPDCLCSEIIWRHTVNRLQLARSLPKGGERISSARRGALWTSLFRCMARRTMRCFWTVARLSFESLLIPDSVKLVISNTMVKPRARSGEYNRRRPIAKRRCAGFGDGAARDRALRDVSLAQLRSIAAC